MLGVVSSWASTNSNLLLLGSGGETRDFTIRSTNDGCEARGGAPIPKWGLSVGRVRFAGESPTFFYAEKTKPEQAVTTVHVATHAPGALYYGLKVVGAVPRIFGFWLVGEMGCRV